MTNDAHIRRALATDEGDLLTIWGELSEYYASLNPTFPLRWQRPDSTAHRLEQLAKLWNEPEHHVGFVATVNSAIEGFCRVDLTPEGSAGASIHTLVVRPHLRKAGIGTKLLHAAIAWCKEQGAVDVSLDVLPVNVDAVAFHTSLGFKPFITSYVKYLR